MCGIVAFVGKRKAQPILLDALARLEYRGYDSAGIALLEEKGVHVVKKAGRIATLAKSLSGSTSLATTGISHTRWATHGEANDVNAHPHLDNSGKLAIVHNGVVENYAEIKQEMLKQGHHFTSQTDTEVLAHLIGVKYDTSTEKGSARLTDAVRKAIREVRGTYGLAAIHADLPGVVVGARSGSPLVLGLGTDENFLSSDATALTGYTQRVVFLKDHDIVTLKPNDFEIDSADQNGASLEIHELDNKTEDVDKGIYSHFMLKEIFEQPSTIRNAMRGRLDRDACSAKLGGLNLTPEELRRIDRIVFMACGTAMHAAMVGERIIESLAHIPVEVEHASEFRYRKAPYGANTLFFVMSQSGETADTLGAMREAQRRGYKCLGICNNVGSTIARESDGGVYMHAGPEVGVAATKSFTSQTTICALLGLLLGRMRIVSASQGQQLIDAFDKLPDQVESILKQAPAIEKIAQRLKSSKSLLFFGRQADHPIALEAALKMKEISYIHAEGYPSAELKHGVIALIDPQTPSIFIMPKDGLFDKNMNNVHEVKARKGPTVILTTEGAESIKTEADEVIIIPKTDEYLQPILNIIPLQLLSFYVATALGRDVDKPRNLAKSVTVE